MILAVLIILIIYSVSVTVLAMSLSDKAQWYAAAYARAQNLVIDLATEKSMRLSLGPDWDKPASESREAKGRDE